jgi:CRP-like cAMP-binding protein
MQNKQLSCILQLLKQHGQWVSKTKFSSCPKVLIGHPETKELDSRLQPANRGQCFGEMSVLTGQPRSADAVVEEETYVLKIDADTLNKETDSFDFRSIQFKFYKIFSEILAQRLAMTNMLLVKPL